MTTTTTTTSVGSSGSGSGSTVTARPPRPESLLRRTERAETQLARLRSQLSALSHSLFQEAERRVEEERAITAQWKQRALDAEQRALEAQHHLSRLMHVAPPHLPIPSRTSSILVDTPRDEPLAPLHETEWDTCSLNSFYSLASTERNHRGSTSVLFLPIATETTSDAASLRTIDAPATASAEALVSAGDIATDAETERDMAAYSGPSPRPLSAILPWFARLRTGADDAETDSDSEIDEEDEDATRVVDGEDSPMTPVAVTVPRAVEVSESGGSTGLPTSPPPPLVTTPRASILELRPEPPVVPPRGNSMSPVSAAADQRRSASPPRLDIDSSADSTPPHADLPAYRPTLPGRLASLVYAPPPPDADSAMNDAGAGLGLQLPRVQIDEVPHLALPPSGTRSASRTPTPSATAANQTAGSSLLEHRRTSTSSSLSGDAHPPPPYRRVLGSQDGVVLIPPRGARWAPSVSASVSAGAGLPPAISLHHESLAPTRPQRASRPRTSDGLISRAAALLERRAGDAGASGEAGASHSAGPRQAALAAEMRARALRDSHRRAAGLGSAQSGAQGAGLLAGRVS